MTRIEYYVCPLCGKTTPLKSFSPEFDLSTLGLIQIREGGGRGSGFRTVEVYSLKSVARHYPEVLYRIRERVSWLEDALQPSPKEIAEAQIWSEIYRQIYQKILNVDPLEISEENMRIARSVIRQISAGDTQLFSRLLKFLELKMQ